MFPLAFGNYYEEVKEESEESSESEDKEKREGEKIRKENDRQINELDKYYGSPLINKYFKEKSLMTIGNNLRNYRRSLPRTQQEYNTLMVDLIVGLNKLITDINYVPKNEVEDMRLEALKNMIEYFTSYNQNLDDMRPLESEEDAAQRQGIRPMTPPPLPSTIGQGLKIMTPNQLITRLRISLAQKKTGNNSQKLNNEIKQILYSLYKSKNLSKTIYNHLINSI